jgi:hypothetical protein
MGPLARALSLTSLALSVFLLSCGGGSSGGSNQGPQTLSVSPQPATIAVGSTVTFTATGTESVISWEIVGTPDYPSVNFGSPTTQTGGKTFVYTAPPTPPLNGPALNSPGTLQLSTSGYPNSVLTTFTITAPSITTGFYPPPSTSVALGSTLTVYGYAVGSTSNGITMEVNGTSGGSASVGTIAPYPNGIYGEYLYTAPATMPMTGSTITLTVISQADPTKSSNLTLTLH